VYVRLPDSIGFKISNAEIRFKLKKEDEGKEQRKNERKEEII
jgi:hypothetical protein